MSVKILIADDEPQNRELVKVVLFKEGYKLFFAEDGLVALSYLQKEEVDVLLLDIMMPKMDGFSLLKEIDRLGIKRPKIIVLSALSDDESKESVLRLGADSFLQKPYDIVALKQQIRLALVEKKEADKDYEVLLGHFIDSLDSCLDEAQWREIVLAFLGTSTVSLEEDMYFLSQTLGDIKDKVYCFDVKCLTPSQTKLHQLMLEKLAINQELVIEKLFQQALGVFL